MNVSDAATVTVTPLAALRRTDAPRVGAKAANLGELLHAGFAVPEGFVATGANEDEVVRQVVAAAADWGDVSLAVRSSIAAEDLPGASFAGQYESVLDVRGGAAVAAAVRRVRSSVASPRVQRYQEELAGTSVGAVGVVVQRLIDADAAGVAFTVNPVTGAREVAVSAVRGLGDALVSGERSPDEWVVRDRETACLRAPEDSLHADQVRAIAATARRVEQHFGAPIDVEWALQADRLWLLQARPVTALPDAAETVEEIPVPVEMPPGFWERDWSHFPQPIAPMSRIVLTASTASLTQMFAETGLPKDGAEFREIGGWVYLGVRPLGGKEPPQPPAWLTPIVNALAARAHPLLRQRIARLHEVERSDALNGWVERWWTADRARFAAWMRRLQDVTLPTLTDDELLDHFDAVVRLCTDGLTMHHLLHAADMGFPVRLALFCADHLGWPVHETFAMLTGLSEASTEPGRALAALADLAARRPAVRALLAQPDRAAVERLEDADGEFAAAFNAYLHEYGCRALRYDVAEPTLAERPEVALGLIRDQLERSYDAKARAAAQRAQRDAAVARARARLADRSAALRERFEWLLERAARSYPVREDNEFYLFSAPIALLRYAAGEIGRRLAERGQLARPDQVFFLEVDEVAAPLRDGAAVDALVRRRAGQAAWVRRNPGPSSYGPEPPEPVLAGLPPLVQEYARTVKVGIELMLEAGRSGRRQDAAHGRIAGVAASPGTYAGPARVIRDEREFTKIRAGDVLVCPITSPVWSVLFASVGALVTDAGGVLSHAAIIAREYHTPAVLATGNATALLRDGQTVIVDGTSGTVSVAPVPQRTS